MRAFQIRSVDYAQRFGRRRMQTTLIKKLCDLRQDIALSLHVFSLEQRARVHELPMCRDALLLERRDVKTCGIINEPKTPLRSEWVVEKTKAGSPRRSAIT